MSQNDDNCPFRMERPIDDTWQDGHHSTKLVKSNETQVVPRPQDQAAVDATQSQRNLFNVITGLLRRQPDATGSAEVSSELVVFML